MTFGQISNRFSYLLTFLWLYVIFITFIHFNLLIFTFIFLFSFDFFNSNFRQDFVATSSRSFKAIFITLNKGYV